MSPTTITPSAVLLRLDELALGDGVLLRPSGELDVATAPALAGRLEALRRRRVPVTLDLGELTFMGSEGVHLLVAAREQARRGWRFAACNPSPAVSCVLAACGQERLLTAGPLAS